MYIIGLSETHNSTAALLRNGELLGCISEERLTRKKNINGYPVRSVEWLLREHGVSAKDLECVVMNMKSALSFAMETYGSSFTGLYEFLTAITYRSRMLNGLYKTCYALYQNTVNRKWDRQHVSRIASHLHIEPEKIVSYPHHLTHAASVVYSMGKQNDRLLVLTSDGAGDLFCASVNEYENYNFKTIATTDNDFSLASLYAAITVYLGMKMNEHEYKVMGLAPYTNPHQRGVQEAYAVLSDLFTVEGMHILSKIDAKHYLYYLDKKLKRLRFDCIAYAAQKLIEDKLAEWLKNAVAATGRGDVCCAGGIFMNVKANKVLSELECVKSLTVMPSSADESSAIGAAYLAYVDRCAARGVKPDIVPLRNLYLGNALTNDAVAAYISEHSLEREFNIVITEEPEQRVAELLASGKIVARVAGRMEFGARALGNRSILAHPAVKGVVQDINDRIKCRDFWMPFAGSILDIDEDRYVKNPKKLQAHYMMLCFDTTQTAHDTIPAALHPYDKTIRPQIVRQRMNPAYYDLLMRFKELTGLGGILNTSLNIHGEPIVCSVEDAIHTLRDSGLEYMQIENYIFEKRSSR
jgi:carbamoyltransferase